jgi:hypothetical protein
MRTAPLKAWEMISQSLRPSYDAEGGHNVRPNVVENTASDGEEGLTPLFTAGPAANLGSGPIPSLIFRTERATAVQVSSTKQISMEI